MLVEEKKVLRNKINAVRNGYQKDWLGEQSRLVSSYLVAWELFTRAKKVSGYLAFDSEVNIDGVLQQALAQGKEVFVPYISDSDGLMHMTQLVSFSEIETGKYGIRTVRNPQIYSCVEDIELVLTPGLAFTLNGGRMGLGKGYYDRFLAQAVNAVKIGITLMPQVVGKLPLEAHDIMMDYIVTEKGIISV